MIIKPSTQGGFLLTVKTEVGACQISFTSVEACKYLKQMPRLVHGKNHKATLHIVDMDAFWDAVDAHSVPVVFVASSAMEGALPGEAA